MSATPTDVLLRLFAQVTGEKDVGKLRTEFDRLAASGDGTAEALNEVAGELDELQKVDTALRSFVKLRATMADTATALDKAKQRVVQLTLEFNAASKPTAKLSKDLERARTEVQRLTTEGNKQKAQLGGLTGALQKAGVDTKKLGDAQRDVRSRMGEAAAQAETLAAKLRNTTTSSNTAGAGLKNLGTQAGGAAQNVQTLQVGLGKIAAAAAAAAAAIGAIKLGTDAFGNTVDLQQGLAQVSAVAGATADQLGAIREAAQDAAADTGILVDEITAGMAELARAGFSAEQAIAALPHVLDLAQAGGVGLSEAVSIAATTLTQFGLAAEDSQRVADVLAKVANATQSSVQGLGLSLSYAAPLARQLGLSLEQTTAIIGAMSDEGFRGERAGTALRNVFSALIDPASKFREALGQLNIRGDDFAQILTELSARGEEGKRALLALDSEARPAILALFNKGGASIEALAGQLRNIAGEASRTAAIMRDTLGNAADRLSNVFDNAFADLIDPVLKPLQAELEKLATQVADFASSPAFGELQQALTEMFVGGIEGAREFAENVDLTEVLERITTFARESGEALRTFNSTFGEVAEGVRITAGFISVIFNTLQTVVFGAATAITSALQQMLQAMDSLSKAGSGPGAMATELGEALGLIPPKVSAIEKVILGLNGVIEEFGKRTVTNFDDAVDAAMGMAGATDDAAASTERLGNAAAAAAPQVETIGDAAQDAGSKAVAAFQAIATSGTAAAGEITAAFNAALGEAGTLAQVQELQNALRVAFEAGILSAQEYEAAIALANGQVVALTDTVDQLAVKAAAAYRELQEAIAMGAAPAVIAELEARFNALNAKIMAAEQAANALTTAFKGTKEEISELEDAFRTLNIQSQEALNKTSASARNAFNTIREAAQEGRAAAENVARAFEAYGRAALAAAANTSQAMQRQVEATLRAEGSAIGATEALRNLGLIGEEAGNKVAAGANRATSALNDTAAAAKGAASAAASVASTSSAAASSLTAVATSASAAAIEVSGVSAAFGELAAQQAGRRGANGSGQSELMRRLQEQRAEAERHLAVLQQQSAQLDEQSQQLQGLRGQYDLLGDEILSQLAAEQSRLAELQHRQQQMKAEADAARRAAEEERRRAQVERNRNAGQEIGTGGVGPRSGARAGSGDGVDRSASVVNNFHFGGPVVGSMEDLAREITTQQERMMGRSR